MTDTLDISRRLTRDILVPMKQSFVGKDEIIDLLGVCLVGNENLFLLGPPGTAKSALVRDLSRRLEGKTFDYLLTRFTEPSELFGPFDIRKLREGDLVTNTEGMLPEASLAFLDELLNANSAILNSLLTVLNERVFRRGRETRRLPLLMTVGASNHLPEDDALWALFDRFLLRVQCGNVSDEHLGDVLDAGWRFERPQEVSGQTVSIEEIRLLSTSLTSVSLDNVREALAQLVHRLRQAGVSVSDRRAVKMQRLVASSALLCCRSEAILSDLWVFRYIWDREEQQEVLASIVDAAIGADDTDTNGHTEHPLARKSTAPDPEMLARDLELIGDGLDADPSNEERAHLRDHLSTIANRCHWVVGEEQRAFLLDRVKALWTRFGDST